MPSAAFPRGRTVWYSASCCLSTANGSRQPSILKSLEQLLQALHEDRAVGQIALDLRPGRRQEVRVRLPHARQPHGLRDDGLVAAARGRRTCASGRAPRGGARAPTATSSSDRSPPKTSPVTSVYGSRRSWDSRPLRRLVWADRIRMSRSWRTRGCCSVLRLACSVGERRGRRLAAALAGFRGQVGDLFIEAGDAELSGALRRNPRQHVEQDLCMLDCSPRSTRVRPASAGRRWSFRSPVRPRLGRWTARGCGLCAICGLRRCENARAYIPIGALGGDEGNGLNTKQRSEQRRNEVTTTDITHDTEGDTTPRSLTFRTWVLCWPHAGLWPA